MTFTDLEIVLQLAICGLLICATALYYIPAPCKCGKCVFHVHERAQARARQLEYEHDEAHKGYGRKASAPDLFPCDEPGCSRNPK